MMGRPMGCFPPHRPTRALGHPQSRSRLLSRRLRLVPLLSDVVRVFRQVCSAPKRGDGTPDAPRDVLAKKLLRLSYLALNSPLITGFV